MNDAENAVYDALKAELALGEAPLSSITWELQETHEIRDPEILRASALTVAASLLADPDVRIYELRKGFQPWPAGGAAAMSQLLDTRTRDDSDASLRSFGWDDQPQLFLLRLSVHETYERNRSGSKRWWQLWSRGT